MTPSRSRSRGKSAIPSSRLATLQASGSKASRHSGANVPLISTMSKQDMEGASILISLATGQTTGQVPDLTTAETAIQDSDRTFCDDNVAPRQATVRSRKFTEFQIRKPRSFTKVRFPISTATLNGGIVKKPAAAKRSDLSILNRTREMLKKMDGPNFTYFGQNGIPSNGAPMHSATPTTSQQMSTAPRVMMPQFVLELIQQKLEGLEDSLMRQGQELTKCHDIVSEVTKQNETLFKVVDNLNDCIVGLDNLTLALNDRVVLLENDNAELRNLTKAKFGGGIRPGKNMSLRLESDVATAVMGGAPPVLNSAGLPTPATLAGPPTGTMSDFAITPGIPKTPASPRDFQKVATTLMNKKANHNLNTMLPPPTVQIPMCALTDRELIIFFYGCTVRPIVSLRLYGRNWGPGAITRVINEYRDVLPAGYLKNTCSVKCAQAIKRGEEMYGEKWKEEGAAFFLEANELDATDAIRLKEGEVKEERDYNVLDMLKGLKKWPAEEDAGDFTQALMWCKENDMNVPLSQIVKVVIALKQKRDPKEALLAHHNAVRTFGTRHGAIRATVHSDAGNNNALAKAVGGSVSMSPERTENANFVSESSLVEAGSNLFLSDKAKNKPKVAIKVETIDSDTDSD